MAELITLPSLAMSLMAFSLMASDLRRASRLLQLGLDF
jgi:hypothetical protein